MRDPRRANVMLTRRGRSLKRFKWCSRCPTGAHCLWEWGHPEDRGAFFPFNLSESCQVDTWKPWIEYVQRRELWVELGSLRAWFSGAGQAGVGSSD